MDRFTVDLPLHSGSAPRWLFDRMKKLAGAIFEVMFMEFNSEQILEKIADPFWFQALGCVLGFDWHSSGLTTTVCSAIKSALRELNSCVIFACGGKGRSALRTPDEIETIADSYCIGFDVELLKRVSRLTAKIDNACVQDGFNLYHHMLFFDRSGNWVVIQQGMQDKTGRWARRYHWYGPSVDDFFDKPHNAIITNRYNLTLNLVDDGQKKTQQLIVSLVSGKKANLILKDLAKLKADYKLPLRHRLLLEDIDPRKIYKILLSSYTGMVESFESLLLSRGIGPKTLRALALISELIYGGKLSFRDPARFAYANGGKDGYPYKVNLADYDVVVSVMNKIVKRAKIGRVEKVKLMRRLYLWGKQKGGEDAS